VHDAVWHSAPASRIDGVALSISLAVPSQCVLKPINGLRYLWKETPCLFKQAAVYNSEDSNLPAYHRSFITFKTSHALTLRASLSSITKVDLTSNTFPMSVKDF